MSLAPPTHDTGTQSTGAMTHRRREIATTALVVSCAPLVLLVFNRDWFVTSDGFLDPWNYVGFFREYLNPDFAPGAYKLGRLPWILSGFLFHRMFSPLWAAYVLHGVFFCATNLAMFAGLYLLFGRLGLAAIVTTLFGFYARAHGAGGWDYHNTAAGLFYLLSVAMLAWPAVVQGRRVPAILTGAVVALAVHSNLELVNFLPALLFIHLTVVRVRTGDWLRLRVVIARAAWALLGAVAVTVVLGVINWMAGREFLFFSVLLTMAGNYVSDPSQYQTQFWQPWSSGWALTGRWLSLPAAVTLAGIMTLIVRRRVPPTPTEQIARALVLQFVVMAFVFVAWQTAGQTALDWSGAYALTPASFVALAALLAPGWPDTSERRWVAITLATATLSAIYLSGTLGFVLESIKTPAAPYISIVGAIVFAAALLIYLTRPRLATTLALVVVFGLGNGVLAGRRYYASDPCKIQPEIYEAIVGGASWLARFDPTHRQMRTWFDEKEQIEVGRGCTVGMGGVASSITQMVFVPYVTRPFPMPGIGEVPDGALRSLAADRVVLAVISSRTEALDRWRQRLDAMGLSHEEVASHTVPLLESGFAIHAWRITERTPTDISFGPSIMTIDKATKTDVNVYGTPKGQIRAAGNRLQFQPTSARDHVAYPFVTLPTGGDDVWARVVVDSQEASSSCQLIVQAQDFTMLGRFECSSGTRYVRVPSTARGLRVYVADPTRRAFVLPDRIDVALSVSKP